VKIPSALRRMNYDLRAERDRHGHVIGVAPMADTDTRKRRAQQCSAAGWLVVHTDRNRAERRAMSRDYGFTGMLRGNNAPHVGSLRDAEIIEA
jgi:hypothetical protein